MDGVNSKADLVKRIRAIDASLDEVPHPNAAREDYPAIWDILRISARGLGVDMRDCPGPIEPITEVFEDADGNWDYNTPHNQLRAEFRENLAEMLNLVAGEPVDFLPSELMRLMDVADRTLVKYVKLAGVKGPGPGQRDFRYSKAAWKRILKAFKVHGTPEYQKRAAEHLQRMETLKPKAQK